MFNQSFFCPSCGHVINQNLTDYVISTSSDERAMGPEIEYSIEYEDECSSCGYTYKVEGSIWEYPIGCENCTDLTIK